MSGTSTVLLDPVLVQSPLGAQAVIFVDAHQDDVVVLGSGEGEWLRALRRMDWRPNRGAAAQYYQALWEFNVEAARQRGQRVVAEMAQGETQGQATLRLVWERPTGGNPDAPVLHPLPPPPVPAPGVVPDQLEPGVVPIRIAGKTPKCFFALLKSFIGIHLMGKGGSAKEVEHHLRISPPFARACGFTLPDPLVGYRHTDIPSLRKLEQFEQIMAARGLWSQTNIQTIRDNLKEGIIGLAGEDLVHDTTHYVAYSAMEVHTVPVVERPVVPSPAATRGEFVPRKQRKVVRRAEVKANRRAAKKEAQRQWRERREEKRRRRQQAQAEGAARKTTSSPTAQLRLPAPTAPATQRKSQSRTIKTCRCRDRQSCRHPWVQADPGAGTVVKGSSAGGKGARFASEEFLYGPPVADSGDLACTGCPLRDACCRRDNVEGRQVAIKFDRLPHIDPGDPPMARRFKAMMRRRTSVERAIKRIKLDFGHAQLTRRGNDAFQAHLDRSLMAFHLMLRLRE